MAARIASRSEAEGCAEAPGCGAEEESEAIPPGDDIALAPSFAEEAARLRLPHPQTATSSVASAKAARREVIVAVLSQNYFRARREQYGPKELPRHTRERQRARRRGTQRSHAHLELYDGFRREIKLRFSCRDEHGRKARESELVGLRFAFVEFVHAFVYSAAGGSSAN